MSTRHLFMIKALSLSTSQSTQRLFPVAIRCCHRLDAGFWSNLSVLFVTEKQCPMGSKKNIAVFLPKSNRHWKFRFWSDGFLWRQRSNVQWLYEWTCSECHTDLDTIFKPTSNRRQNVYGLLLLLGYMTSVLFHGYNPENYDKHQHCTTEFARRKTFSRISNGPQGLWTKILEQTEGTMNRESLWQTIKIA